MMRRQDREGEMAWQLGEDTDAGHRTGDFTSLCTSFLHFDVEVTSQ